MSTRILFILVLALTLIIAAYYSYFSARNAPQVFTVDTTVTQSNSTTEETRENIEENLPDQIYTTVKGGVSGILAKSDNPEVLVYLQYVDSQGNKQTKVTSLNYEDKYEFVGLNIKPTTEATLTVKSSDYVFYPAEFVFEINEEYVKKDFEASIVESTKQGLNINGNFIGSNPDSGVVYVYGTSVVEGKTTKTLVPIRNGKFTVQDIDSGTYLIIPSSEKYIFFPKTKNVFLKNKTKNISFFALRRLQP